MKRLYAALLVSFALSFPAPASEVVVSISETNTYQQIEGFGASLTDSSAWLLTNALSGVARTNLLTTFFSPTNGIGISFLRQPMGASDFRLANYTYDDMAAGQTDYAMTNFSIAHDQPYIIPLIKVAIGMNTNMKIMGTPWSPPAWMKTSNDFYSGQLKTNCYSAYAKYFLKYVQSYGSNGIPIFAVSLQNEPLYEPFTYPGMKMAATNEIPFAILVGQHFQSNGVATKILAYDHNWDRFDYPLTVLSNATASSFIAGSAFHAYAGDVSAQSIVHNAFPSKDIYFTENTAGSWSGTFSDILMWDIKTLYVASIRNWSKAVIKWNLALDQNGGPKIAGGCSGCRGLVTINTNTHTVVTNADFYALAHVSKFVKPGAYRVEAGENVSDGPFSVAFVNPDSNLVVVAYNDSVTTRNYSVRWQSQSISVPLPTKSIVTLTWPNIAGATADVWMTCGDQTKLLQKQAYAPVFRPLALSWKGRTWTVRDSEGNPGNNLWMADCVRVDTNDWLHLQVKTNAGTWYCGQVESTDSPGFGTYRWYTVGRASPLDTNVVGNLSTYANITHELDIQFAYAFDEGPTNFIYSVQPYYLTGHRDPQAVTFTNNYTTHEFTWNPRTVAYRSWYGHSAQPSNAGVVIDQWTYEGTDVPGNTNQHVRMSLWMYNTVAPAATQELVLADFAYACSTGTLLRDDFEDASVGPMWLPYGTGTVSESGGDLRFTTPDANGESTGCRTTNIVSWSKNGLSYLFTANLSTITVSTARGAGGVDVWGYQAILGGSNGVFDPYAASNAVILRAGYDASTNQLTLELLTKEGSANSWGTSRFVGTIGNASTFFNNGSGLEIRFALVYSNYQVSAYYQGSAVSITTVSGAVEAAHGLDPTHFAAGRYAVGAMNHDDGRGSVSWEQVHVHADAELPSTAADPDGGGADSSLIQIGAGDSGNSWREPIGAKYSKFRSEVLYRSDQIGLRGTITQIQVKVLSPPAIALANYTIRMQLTGLSSLSTNFVNSNWTQVYRSNTTIATGFSGWYSFALQTNFHYNGSSNLLVDFITDGSSRDDTPQAAATYSVGTGVQGAYAGNNSGTPSTWANTGSKSYSYVGNKYSDIRLAISNDQPIVVGANLDFENGPRGYLTNIPSWHVEGSEMSGYIKGSPVYHGTNSLKLWKDGGNGDQKVYQFFDARSTNQYILGGYILAESTEPFVGTAAYGAFLLEWYGASGLLRSDESDPFTPTNTFNVWQYVELATVPPANTTSGRIVCALFSSDDQNGSLYFDRLNLTYVAAPPPTGAVAVSAVSILRDEFNDTSMSNLWTQCWPWYSSEFQETNGHLRVKPGTNFFESTGYVSTQPLYWNNTSCWYVFSAVLTTIKVDSAAAGNDVETLLGICSMPDNPWWVTNSVGVYGYYDVNTDQIVWQLLLKANLPAANGTERFNASMTNVSAYLNGSNSIRVSVALGLDEYEIRFSDAAGLPIPYTLNVGEPRGSQSFGTLLNKAYWFIGAQADNYNRGSVFWDRTAIYTTLAPTSILVSTAQTSRDGTGLVTISNRVSDGNGDSCRLRIEASTNNGLSWSGAWISGIVSDYGASPAPTQTLVQAVSIITTNADTLLVATNVLALTWNTRSDCNGFSLAGVTCTNVLIRTVADDGDVSSRSITSTPILVDNEAPSAQSAAVSIEDGAAWTFSTDLLVSWSGFSDAGAGLAGWYVGLVDGGGSTAGMWSAVSTGTVAGAATDVRNVVYVWAADSYGNCGASATDDIVVLSSSGDYDLDGLINTDELRYGASPLDADSDADGMGDGWEVRYGFAPTNSDDAAADGDGDGYNNRLEFLFDTLPGDAASHQVLASRSPGAGDVFVQWSSSTGRVYSLYRSASPSGSWSPVPDWTNRPGTGDTMVFTGSSASVSFDLYRIGARLPTP